MKKHVVAAGLAAGLIAGAGVAFALESSNDDGGAAKAPIAIDASSGGDILLPDAVGGDVDRETMLRNTLQPLVDDGTLTADQLDKVVAALAAAGPGMGDGMGQGQGPGPGQGDGQGHGGAGGQMRGPNLQTVADELGITVDEVRTAIQSGTTLADLAEQQGKDAQDLIDALVAEAQTRLAAQVSAGNLTQDEADARLEEATERITDFVNDTQAAGPGGLNG